MPGCGWEPGAVMAGAGSSISIRQILMPSPLSWEGCWPVPHLQSPENQNSLF